MSDVGDVARAVEQVAKVVYSTLNPSQQKLIADAYSKGVKDCESLRNYLLAGDDDRAQLLYDGLVLGFRIDITPDQRKQLGSTEVGNRLDLYDILGFYCRARYAEFAQATVQIVQTSDNKE